MTDEYLWGSEVLVAPVFKKGARSRKVYFPAGDTWINWNKPSQTFAGGTTATVAAPLEEMPMFVKAGSFIPQYMRPIENVSQYDPMFLTVKYFPSKESSSFTMFDDNRLSPTSLSDGQYQLTTFTAVPQGRKLEIDIESEGSYKEMPEGRMITLEIPGIARPARVTVGGERLTEVSTPKAIRNSAWCYNAATRTLTIGFGYAYKPLKLVID